MHEAELLDEFFRLADSLVLQVGLGLADNESPLIFPILEQLDEHVDGQQGHVESLYIASYRERLKILADPSVLNVAIFEEGSEGRSLGTVPEAGVVLA